MGSVLGQEKIPSEQGHGLDTMKFRREPNSAKRSVTARVRLIHSNVEWSWRYESMEEAQLKTWKSKWVKVGWWWSLDLRKWRRVSGVRGGFLMWVLMKLRRWVWFEVWERVRVGEGVDGL